jgi:lipid II:glycine glycyltransferase (peptidoglycan interpeptide bridge formation enzyme)
VCTGAEVRARLSLKPTDLPGDQWDRFVASHPQAHLLQTSSWGELKSRFGWSAERVALSDPSQNITAGAQILYRRLPPGMGTLAYVPKGPLVDWQDSAHIEAALTVLDRAARARKAIALTIEPNLLDRPEHADRLVRAGFVPGAATIQPRRTLLIDLSADEEAILAAMKSKTRYNIRLSMRKGVTVRQGHAADVETFNGLLAVTGDRSRFGVHSPAYYSAAFDLFGRDNQVSLFLAEYQGEPLAGLMVFALGDSAWYFYGASSDAHRDLMAPYAVQWAAMCWAKARGCATYDLWGVPDEDEEMLEAQFAQRQDGLWGVYRFKRGFGGRLVRSIGAWDRVYRPLLYRLYRRALRWR